MPAVAFGIGMGVDSIAALHALLHMSEAERGFAIDDLVCISAQTGAEYPITAQLMERYALPTMRRFGVRYVQISRAGPRKADGYVVLDDSRSPQRMHMRGPWTLTDEYTVSGTAPQVSNRRCSHKAKGQPMDAWLADNLGTGYVHMLGFSAGEGYRIARDQTYTTNGRIPRYPLAEMGWDRQTALGYLHEVYGVTWSRSCCVYCPFQAGASGIGELVARWRADPTAAAHALIIEDRALALNGNAALFGDRTARSIVCSHEMTEALAAAEAVLEQTEVALYAVRRIRHAPTRPGRAGKVWRSVRTLATGSRTAMLAQLRDRADDAAVPVTLDEHGIPRAWIKKPELGLFPGIEHQLTIGPTGVDDKQRPGFATRWAEITGEDLATADRIALSAPARSAALAA